jgi:hypothetical protein
LAGSSSRLLLNATYNRTADDEARVEVGDSENLGQTFEIQRLRYVERTVASGQLAGEHQLGSRTGSTGAATPRESRVAEPDRSEFVRQIEVDAQGNPLPPAWFNVSNEGAVRTFADLDERSFEGSRATRSGSGSRGNRGVSRSGERGASPPRRVQSRVRDLGDARSVRT